MKLVVDLNADLGEGAGHDDEMLEFVTSANIACGFHAGDADTIHMSIEAARDHGVAVGAHPSLFDRENFGRKELPVTPEEVCDAVTYQLGVFSAIAEALGVRPNHVKPHGALYNMAVHDEKIAGAIARAIASTDRALILFAPEAPPGGPDEIPTLREVASIEAETLASCRARERITPAYSCRIAGNS